MYWFCVCFYLVYSMFFKYFKINEIIRENSNFILGFFGSSNVFVLLYFVFCFENNIFIIRIRVFRRIMVKMLIFYWIY